MKPVRLPWLAGALVAASVALVALGSGVGSQGWLAPWQALAQAWHDPVVAQIVWEIRLPRTLGAWAAGALLGLAGAVAQGLFRNPLGDPYPLGRAPGAALGVALMLALSGAAAGLWGGAGVSVYASHWLVRLGLTGAAFVGAVLAVLLTLALARGVQHTLRLLLAGVVVGVVLGALGALVLQFAPEALLAMQSFMLGSTAYVGWSACVLMLGVGAFCLLLSWVLARALDGLALGEATALSLGLPLGPLRMALVGAMALATGTAVAQTGLIAFVGLAAPHLVRATTLCSHRGLMPLASLMGGVLLCAADLVARGAVAPQELPVGVLTAVLGGGYLLLRMHRRGPMGELT